VLDTPPYYMKKIYVEHLRKKYNKLEAVKDISFDVQGGEIFGLIGPNGSGKTTTLHAVVGIVTPTSGRVEIDGIEAGRTAAKHRFGFVPDDLGMPLTLTGEEFLRFTRKLYGIDDDRRTMVLVRIFGMEQALSRLIEEYSHGMKKKLLIIASLLHDPEILIFDEPFRGLDPETVITLKTLISREKERGKAILVASHDLLLAQHYFDRVAVIARGRVVALGTIDALLREYETRSLEEVFLIASGLMKRRKEVEKELDHL